MSEEQSEQPEIEITADISFSIDSNGDYHIRYKLDDVTDNTLVTFGTLLYSINSGFFISRIIEVLHESVEENPVIEEYIKKVLAVWEGHLANENEEPMVSPLDALKIAEE
jgi:hypothetical protein